MNFKLHKLCRLCRRDRVGAAVVEFALVAPLFFLFVMGMVECGRMMMVQQILTNASREGARRAVLEGTVSADVVAAVDSYLANSSISGADVTVTEVAPVSPDYAKSLTVTVQVPFSEVSWLPTPMFVTGNYTLSAATTMRQETVE